MSPPREIEQLGLPPPPVTAWTEHIIGYFAGIDWSESSNDVAVVDDAGHTVARAQVPESPDGITQVLRLLAGLRTSHRHSRKAVPIAIETSHGLLVAALRAAGQPVVAINPMLVPHYRGRLNPTKKKSDKSDAVLLAHILRTDGHQHRPLPHDSDHAMAIKVLARAHWATARARQHYQHQLRALLRAYHPAMLDAWADLPGGLLRAEARAVLAVAATPGQARGLSVRALRATLADAGRTRLLDDHALRLHSLFHDKTLRQRPAVEDAMGAQALALLGMLDRSCQTVDDMAARMAVAFEQHPQAPIYLSFPGVGGLIGARLLAEIGDDPDRFADARGLRAYAGAAPLTWASGSSNAVTHRKIANKRLKAIGHHWAFCTLTRSPGCRERYDLRRERGDRHAAALRNLYARLLSCLHYCLQHSEQYHEERAWRHSIHTGQND